MKKTFKFLISFILILSLSVPVFADRTEKVRVIKFNKDNYDLIIERNNGEKMLIQHHYICNSMTTEFPVDLVWDDEEVTQLRVAYNEICDVYNAGAYTDDITITKRIKSENILVKDHLAEIIWKDRKYEIDYGDGCEELRNFEGEIAFVNARGTIEGATLYLPRNRGQCTINSAKFLEEVESPETMVESPMTNLQYKAENNEVYFYWDEAESDTKWVYLISHSRYKINPEDYHYRQMPNLRFSVGNTYTATTLANGRKYYFYLSARDSERNVAPWIELEITPVQTREVFHNNPDPDPFEIELTENTDEYFLLTWPDKSEDSKRYILQYFIDGKRQFLKIISGEINEYKITKEPQYENAGFRFEVRSIPKDRFGKRFSDGIFWKNEED